MRSLSVPSGVDADDAPNRRRPRRRRVVALAVLVGIPVLAGLVAAVVLRSGWLDDPEPIRSDEPAPRATTDAVPAGPDVPEVFRYYGNAQIPVSLADTEAGGRSITAVSHRVRFPRDGVLEAVRPFIIYVPGQEGDDGFYHKGDGGTIEFRLEADDGTPAHNPSGEVLARTGNLVGAPELYEGSGPDDARVGGQEGDDANFRRFSFLEPVPVEAGRWYHLVMYNTGDAPADNFVSYDHFYAGEDDRDPRVPMLDDLDFAVSYQSEGIWNSRDDQWGIGEFAFSDGTTFGNGYMEVGSVDGPDRAANPVDPDQLLRQRLRPPEDLIVSEVHVGAMHVAGPNSLRLTLTDSDRRVLWTGDVDDFPTGRPSNDPLGNESLFTAAFRGAAVRPTVVLQADREYFLIVESVGGTHTVTAARDGSRRYGFAPGSTVDGHAELRQGSGRWEGWHLGDAGPTDEFDLSFFLVTENCVGCG